MPIFLLANLRLLCYHGVVSEIKENRDINKGGFIMQNNRQDRNKIEELSIKGTAIRRYVL